MAYPDSNVKIFGKWKWSHRLSLTINLPVLQPAFGWLVPIDCVSLYSERKKKVKILWIEFFVNSAARACRTSVMAIQRNPNYFSHVRHSVTIGHKQGFDCPAFWCMNFQIDLVRFDFCYGLVHRDPIAHFFNESYRTRQNRFRQRWYRHSNRIYYPREKKEKSVEDTL